MKEIRHLKTIKNKRNLNTKLLLLQNDQNADTTLLHSHDVFKLIVVKENVKHGNGESRFFQNILIFQESGFSIP